MLGIQVGPTKISSLSRYFFLSAIDYLSVYSFRLVSFTLPLRRHISPLHPDHFDHED